ncbi:hypothetical protein [Streptomyces sennicomposti]|uniref:hypothetical protein n=1 Tax=Streptomyces sennicomposti TaxID=2873384 RepID=UPI001CA6EBBE|nr:hypothetical protein [Streptomyces sennicomposti]MBY8866709.1 hypothetical protein [Streptomyces sennicomposti]
MTDRPYETPQEGAYGTGPHEGYDPYAQQYQQQYPQGQQHVQQYPQGQHPQAHAQQQHPQAHAQQYPQNHSQQYPQQQPPQAPQHPQQHPQGHSQAWPGQQQAYGDPHADDLQYTQEWQGQTWETQTYSRIDATAEPAAPTAYMAPLNHLDHLDHLDHQTPAAAPAPAPAQPQTAQPQPAQPQTARPQPTAASMAPAAPTAPAGNSGDGSEPGYGPATLGGNARVTDAQRARAEGRSPIIEPGMQPAALTALLGLLLAGAAQVGTYALLVPLVLLQAVTAAGWFRLNGMWPARQGIALGFAGALVCDAAVLGTGRDHAPAAILGTLGVWVLLSLVLQLRSHADPDERMYGLMATVAAAALAILATGYLAGGADAVTVGAASAAVAVLARALPLPTAASVVVALLAAAGAGIAVGGVTDLGSKGAVLGAGAAVCALIGHRAASYDYPSRFVHFTAGVALPLTAAAPVVWVLGRAIG